MAYWEGSHHPKLRQVLRWILGVLQRIEIGMSNYIMFH